MLPTFGSGRGSQFPEYQRAHEPRNSYNTLFTGAPGPVLPEPLQRSDSNLHFSTLARAWSPDSAEIPRNFATRELGGLPVPPSTGHLSYEAPRLPSLSTAFSPYSGALAPEAGGLPRTLVISGVRYHREEMGYGADESTFLNDHQGTHSQGSMPLAYQDMSDRPYRDGMSLQGWASEEAQLEELFVNSDAQQQQNNQSLGPESDQGHARLQSESAPVPVQTSPKLRRESRRLREIEIEAHNQSPVSESDREQSRIRSESPRAAIPVTPRSKQKSQLLRELKAHNVSPPEPKPNPKKKKLADFGDDWHDTFRTRNSRKNILNFVNGEPPEPRKNLNVGRLMLDQFSGIKKGTKTFFSDDNRNTRSPSRQRQQMIDRGADFGSEDEGEEGDLPNFITTNSPRPTHRVPKPRTMPTLDENPAEMEEMPIDKGLLNQKSAAGLTWERWDSQRDRTTELIKSPRFNPHPSQEEIDAQGRKKPAYHITAEKQDGVQGVLSMERGLYVFTPTAADLLDFGHFLKDVEEIAGRKMGVVKVVVPSECLSPAPLLSRSKSPRSSVVKTMSVNIIRNEDTAEKPLKVYNMVTKFDSNLFGAEEWLRLIRRDKKSIIQKRNISAQAIRDDKVWEESHVIKPYTEESMLRHGVTRKEAVCCALNEPASDVLRAALGCKHPNIENLTGNRFASSQPTQPGINEPVFHLAAGPGPLFPLQMNKHAAYSLNYHHSGAPRTVTVTLPEYHAKVEQIVYDTQSSGTLSSRPQEPPTCSQFVEHQHLFVPCSTLSSHDIEYTRAVQYQGEMVITFPYAYHQVYSSGPNITEEISYASDRCKVFHREKVYHHCNRNCTAGQSDNIDISTIFTHTLSATRTSHRRRSGLEPFSTLPTRGQTSEAGSSQQRDAEDRPFRRVRGLKAIDRLFNADDGEYIDPSDPEYRFQPRRPGNPTQMTSDPQEADIWDPESAFEDRPRVVNNDEDSDDGSPIGGIRPRRRRERRASKRYHSSESDEEPRKHSRTD